MPIRPENSEQWNARIPSTAIPRSPSNNGKRGLPGGAARAGDGAAAGAGVSPAPGVALNMAARV
jgi:hypothetical protein